MRRALLAAVVICATAGVTSAQGLVYKPIDTNALVVRPADTATGFFSGTTRFLSRVVADTIDDNGFVKTINNLLGTRRTGATTQPGVSPLPLPGSYPSTMYKNSFVPALPTYHTLRR